MKNQRTIRGFIALAGSCILISALVSCSFTLASRSLTAEEGRFLGLWTHVHGPGNVWNKDFQEGRVLHSYATNLILGSSEGYHLWEADGSTLSLYEKDSPLLHLERSVPYSFTSDTILVLDGNEYEKQ